MTKFELSVRQLEEIPTPARNGGTEGSARSTPPPTEVGLEDHIPNATDNNASQFTGEPRVSDIIRHLQGFFRRETNFTVVQDGEITRVSVDTVESSSGTEVTPTPYELTDGGNLHTGLVRHAATGDQLHDHMFVDLGTTYASPPSIIVGLNRLEASRDTNVRVHATAEDVHEHTFGLHFRSWGDSRLAMAGCTWLAVPANHPAFQVGTCQTTHHTDQSQHLTDCNVTFQHPYDAPPKVVMWLNRLDISRDKNKRIMAFATDITSTGFTAHINSWGDTILHGAGVSWFAYPVGTPGISSGTVTGVSGVVRFETKFSQPPRRVLVGLNRFDTDAGDRCRVEVIHEAVSKRGMGVRIRPWGNSVLHSAGVSYLVIE